MTSGFPNSEHTYNRKTCFIDSWRRAVDISPPAPNPHMSDGAAGESGEPAVRQSEPGLWPPSVFCVRPCI